MEAEKTLTNEEIIRELPIEISPVLRNLITVIFYY